MALDLNQKYIKVIKGGITYNLIAVNVVQGGVTTNVWGASSAVVYVVDSGISYSEDVIRGDSVLSPTSFTPSKVGYTFIGWRTDKTASSDVLTSLTMGTSPITLYAVFKKTITLTYNGNDSTSGSVSSQTGTQYYNNGNAANPIFTLASNGFSKTDYSFIGWDLGGTTYSAGANVTMTTSATLYATWVATVTNFNYNGAIQTYTSAVDGTYQLEVWGAQGGNASGSKEYVSEEHDGWNEYETVSTTCYGGNGGYSKGNIYLTKGQVLYIVVGGVGNGSTGGYNGGGHGYYQDEAASSAGGGGATHIATANGVLSSLSSNKSAVLIVAGGGGGACVRYWGESYNDVPGNYGGDGGTGGGLTGGISGAVYASHSPDLVGSQTDGFAFGQGQNSNNVGDGSAGCGGGWYGGKTIDDRGGTGGSGYIGGVTDGYTYNGYRSGNGYARISLVS